MEDHSSPEVSRQRSRPALVLKGGGVKGLALAGAVLELQRAGREFGTYVGTSAGAILAALLASGYTARQLIVDADAPAEGSTETIPDTAEFRGPFWEKDFREFLDRNPLIQLWNLLSWRWGLHSGDEIEEWLKRLIRRRLWPDLQDAKAQILPDMLPERLVVYASGVWEERGERPTIVFDSIEEKSTYSPRTVDFAVRSSMSIPFFFTRMQIDDRKRYLYDGGLLANYPAEPFCRDNPEYEDNFIGLYLAEADASTESSDDPPRKRGLLSRIQSPLGHLAKLLLSSREYEGRLKYPEMTIPIDPSPVRTVDFDLSVEEKEHLILQGRLAALRYLKDDDRRRALEEPARKAKAAAEAAQTKRKWLRRLRRTAFCSALAVVLYAGFVDDRWLMPTTSSVDRPVLDTKVAAVVIGEDPEKLSFRVLKSGLGDVDLVEASLFVATPPCPFSLPLRPTAGPECGGPDAETEWPRRLVTGEGLCLSAARSALFETLLAACPAVGSTAEDARDFVCAATTRWAASGTIRVDGELQDDPIPFNRAFENDRRRFILRAFGNLDPCDAN